MTAFHPSDLAYSWTTSCPGILNNADTASPLLIVDAGTEPAVCESNVVVCAGSCCVSQVGMVRSSRLLYSLLAQVISYLKIFFRIRS